MVLIKSIRTCAVASILILLVSTSCDDRIPKGFERIPLTYPDKCQTYDFEIRDLPYDDLPFVGWKNSLVRDSAFPRDHEDVRLYEYNGRYYYHPIVLANRGYVLAAYYHRTKDSAVGDLLVKHVNRLLREADDIDGALYYPYRYDNWANQQPDGLLKAPWYSGLAQGEVLGLLCRTFSLTGDSVYLEAAHRTFETFLRPRGESEPWTVFIDDAGCYWIEEYPTEEPSRTLNGFIFGIYGVYDYYQLTRSEEAARIIKISCSTIKNYISVFRRPGRVSYYGLTFGHYTYDYHLTHINQLHQLQKITGDPFFTDWADSLASDYSD